ncbi:uncharacterized protein LOC144706294 [Wolffia australiana]
MANIFNIETLAEKLAKLNNSQQSIETLSHWCIFHRKKARQVVETWEKQFSNSKEQRVPFLYLANDILQNSRRKGSEFVNEFWKVLPRALKIVVDDDDEQGKNVVSRLVDIWDDRKVFGSRSKSLKDEMMGKDTPAAEINGAGSNLIKIVKKDSQMLRIKLAIGGMPEKILTAFQSVLDEHVNEDVAVHRFHAAIQQVGRMEKEAAEIGSQGGQEAASLMIAIQEQEEILGQCIEQLEGVETSREALIVQLSEALQEQESKIKLVRSQLQIIRSERERAMNLKQRLSGSDPAPGPPLEHGLPMTNSVMPMPPPPHPITSFTSYFTTAEVQNKKAAAEVVAKLTASTSSAQMLSSVLSSLVAEEAASSNGLKPSLYPPGSPYLPDKRPKLEKPLNAPDMASIFLGQPPQPLPPPPPPQFKLPSSGGPKIQPISQNYPLQSSHPPPPPPQPYPQSSGPMVNVLPYSFGATILPPLPHHPLNMTRQSQQQSSLQPPPPPPPQHEQAVFYQGAGFYGQPSPAPVQRP